MFSGLLCNPSVFICSILAPRSSIRTTSCTSSCRRRSSCLTRFWNSIKGTAHILVISIVVKVDAVVLKRTLSLLPKTANGRTCRRAMIMNKKAILLAATARLEIVATRFPQPHVRFFVHGKVRVLHFVLSYFFESRKQCVN